MATMQLYWPHRTQTVLLAQLRDNSPSSSLVGQRSCRSRVIWWRLIVSFYMLSTEVLGLCDDELFLDWGNGIVNGVWLFHLSMNLPVCIDFVMAISLDLASSLFHLFFCFHWLLLIFYSFRRTGPLPMMSLLHTICWLFYYWAHPIADDVFVPIHLSPFMQIHRCNTMLLFLLVLWGKEATYCPYWYEQCASYTFIYILPCSFIVLKMLLKFLI